MPSFSLAMFELVMSEMYLNLLHQQITYFFIVNFSVGSLNLSASLPLSSPNSKKCSLV